MKQVTGKLKKYTFISWGATQASTVGGVYTLLYFMNRDKKKERTGVSGECWVQSKAELHLSWQAETPLMPVDSYNLVTNVCTLKPYSSWRLLMHSQIFWSITYNHEKLKHILMMPKKWEKGEKYVIFGINNHKVQYSNTSLVTQHLSCKY